MDAATAPVWQRALIVFAGGFLGTAARVALLGAFADQAVGLAVINVAGCLALGVISGWFGSRVTWLRLFLAVGGVASFTSWSSLALQSVGSLPGVAWAVAETAIGISFAGLGHVAGRRWRP